MAEVESKAAIGLSWQPKLPPLLPSGTNNGSHNKPPQTLPVYNKPNTPSLLTTVCLFNQPNNPTKWNKLLKKQLKDTAAGKNWFGMPTPTITPELKKDLQLLQLRSVVDPKRHYKKGVAKSQTFPKHFQVGTVIESAADFFTGRLSKKERKATLADELLSNHTLGEYRKRKVREIEEQNHPAGVEKWKIKGRQSSWKQRRQ